MSTRTLYRSFTKPTPGTFALTVVGSGKHAPATSTPQAPTLQPKPPTTLSQAQAAATVATGGSVTPTKYRVTLYEMTAIYQAATDEEAWAQFCTQFGVQATDRECEIVLV